MAKKRRRKAAGTAGLGKFVSRKKGLYSSGPKKGKLKKGCKWVKSRGGARISCVPKSSRSATRKCTKSGGKCRFGVNKNTGKCLKHKRRRKR